MYRSFLIIISVASILALGTSSFFYTNLSSCISQNGTPILGLSSDTNAHVEVGSTSMDYNQYVLCLKDKFVKNISVAFGDCSENVVLRMYSSKNSHVEIPEGNVYLNKICINSENLTVVCGTSGDFENYTLRLSSLSNAHAELPNLSNYPTLVGCNVSYKDGTVCEEDRNCLSNNCAGNILGSKFVCSPKGYCYDGGFFFENASCHLGNLCWNEEWISDGDFNELACNCSTNGNSTWMGLCCGDDPEENVRVYKKNFDFDLYLDEIDWKGNSEIIGNYSITKDCLSDFCIIPEYNVTINGTGKFTRDFIIGFSIEGNIEGKILEKGNLSVTVSNNTLNISVGGYYIERNISSGWNYVLMEITNGFLKLYIDGIYVGEMPTNSISDNNVIIYSKVDEFFIVGRTLNTTELNELLDLLKNRTCVVGEKCILNGTEYYSGSIVNGYNCSGRYWDKIPYISIIAKDNPVILDIKNSTDVVVTVWDDDAREISIINISIIDPYGNTSQITQYNITRDRKFVNISFREEFRYEGYYDIFVEVKDKNSKSSKYLNNFVYVAKSAGEIERVYVYPKLIKPGENVTVVVTFRNSLYNISEGTSFNITLRNSNYTVIQNAVADKNIGIGEVVNLTFVVNIYGEKIIERIIPEVHFNYNGSSLVAIPKIIDWDINTDKKIYKRGEKVSITGYPHIIDDDQAILTNTTLKVFNSNYQEVFKKEFKNIDSLSVEIPTDNWPCDLYIISIYSESGNYSGETAIPIVLTGCYV